MRAMSSSLNLTFDPRERSKLTGLAFAIGAAVLLLLPTHLVSAVGTDETVIISGALEPGQLEVDPGTTVTWHNEDPGRHRVRSDDGPERFDSKNLDRGESFSFTFTVEGSYPYYDHRNPDETAYFGVIVVGGAEATADGPLPDDGTLSIVDRSFRPPSFTIATGGTIEWSNDDGEAHTVTSTDSAFDSGILNSGATFSQTFAEPGSYPYFCAIHPEMRGTISVSDPVDDPALVEPGTTTDDGQPPAGEVDAATPEVDAATGAIDDGAGVAAPDPGTAPGAIDTAPTVVSTIDRSFQPASVEVAAGDTVTWSNDDTEGHTVTAIDGAFNSGVMTVGDEFSMSFDTPGTFDYFCAIHPEMTGMVVVTEPDPEPPTDRSHSYRPRGPGGPRCIRPGRVRSGSSHARRQQRERCRRRGRRGSDRGRLHQRRCRCRGRRGSSHLRRHRRGGHCQGRRRSGHAHHRPRCCPARGHAASASRRERQPRAAGGEAGPNLVGRGRRIRRRGPRPSRS